MSIDRSVKDFIGNPERYELLIATDAQSGEVLKAERKGFWNYMGYPSSDIEAIAKVVAKLEYSESRKINVEKFLETFKNLCRKYNASQNPVVMRAFARIEKIRMVTFTINKIISDHLKPYLDGRINIVNEKKKRPLITKKILSTVQHQFPEFHFDPERLSHTALKAYIYQAVCAFNVSQQKLLNPADPQNSALLKDFEGTLLHALSIDFKGASYKTVDVMEQAKDQFWQIYQEDREIKGNPKSTRRGD